MLKTITLSTLASAALLTACSSGSSDSKPESGADTAAVASATATTSPAPKYRILDKGALEDALLTIDDFPTGFSQDAESQQEDSKTFCDYKEPTKPKVRASADFTKGAGMDVQAGAVILRQYESVDAAKTAFDALTNELKTCRRTSSTGQRPHTR